MGENNQVLVLNNGVYLQETKYNVNFHLTVPEALSQNGSTFTGTDLGVLTTFAQSGVIPKQELFPFSTLGANRMYVKDNMFTWSHATSENSFYIVEDLSGVLDPGCSGEKFKVAFNMRKYDNHYTIKPDMHLPFEFLITGDEIIQESPNRFIYTLQVKGVSKDKQYNVKQFLQTGTTFMPVTTYETQSSQIYSTLPSFSGGMRKYFNVVGHTRSQLHIHVDRDAAYKRDTGKWTARLDQYQNLVESFVFRPGTFGYDMSMLPPEQRPMNVSVRSAYAKQYGGDARGMSQFNRDILYYTWVPKVEMIATRYMQSLVEQEAMWGSGGMVQLDGGERVQTALGLFHQLNMGNEVIMGLNNFTMDKLAYVIQSRLQGKVTPFSGNVIRIRTGMGGLAWVKAQLRKLPAQYGMVWNADKTIQGTGQSLHFATPDFTSYDLPSGLGKLVFEHAPALDPEYANSSVNPIVPLSGEIGGHRLSSYMFLIDDLSVNAEGGNILELVCDGDWDFSKQVIVGKLPYMGVSKSMNEWEGSHLGPGFDVYLTKKHKAYFLKDPTRSLIIKPINPFTGMPIFTY